MRALLLTVAFVASLGGCDETPVEQMGYASQKALASEIIGRCTGLGIAMDSPEMGQCTSAELERERALRAGNRETRLRAAAAMSAYGQSRQQAAATAAVRRPVNCSSQVFGDVMNTSCY